MKSWIRSILFPEPAPHPFGQRQAMTTDSVIEEPSVAPDPDGVESVNWGRDNVVKAVVTNTTDSIEWKTYKKGDRRLKPVDLDKYDMQVIRQRNSSGDKRKYVNPNNYKLVKSYVIAGQWTNKEIATILKMSRSWVERLAPRIKEAAKLRRQSEPSPIV